MSSTLFQSNTVIFDGFIPFFSKKLRLDFHSKANHSMAIFLSDKSDIFISLPIIKSFYRVFENIKKIDSIAKHICIIK
jgi:hypothetical protein